MTFTAPFPLVSYQRQLTKLSTLQHSHICPIYSITTTSPLTLQCRLQLLPYSLAYIVASYSASPWDERKLLCQFLALIDVLARLQSQNIAHMQITLDHLMVDTDLSAIQLISFACNGQAIDANSGEWFREDVRALGMCFLAVAYIGQDFAGVLKGGAEQAVRVALAGLKSDSHLVRVLSRALGAGEGQTPDASTLMREFWSVSLCTKCVFCQNRQQTWQGTTECYPKMLISPPRFCELCKRPLDKMRDEQATICSVCIAKGLTSSPKPTPSKKPTTPHSKCRSCGRPYDPRISFSPEGFCSDQCKYDYGNPHTHSQPRCQSCSAALTRGSSRSAGNGDCCSEKCSVDYAMKLSLNDKA
jgi:hypothetical protein